MQLLTFLSSLCPLFLSSPSLSLSFDRFISLSNVGTCLSMRKCMCVSLHYVYLVCLSSSLGVCSCNHLSHSCLYYSPKIRARLATWQRCWQAIGTPHTHASNMASYTLHCIHIHTVRTYVTKNSFLELLYRCMSLCTS